MTNRLPNRAGALAAWVFLGLFAALAGLPGQARAADRDRIEAFLGITGFDAALDSIAFSASSAPQMLGMPPDRFGVQWLRLTQEVFDTDIMRGLAVDILSQTLSDEMLAHAAEFYAGELGQRLVAAENESHLIEDDSARLAEGQRLLAEASDADRVAMLERMIAAVDGPNTSLRALQEIQLRFLMSAAAAGVIDLRMDEDEMRAQMKTREPMLRRMLEQSALAGAAFTYRDMSMEDLTTYAEALEHPDMRRVYELLNAVQYEIMANRFEVLARRMADLQPVEDI